MRACIARWTVVVVGLAASVASSQEPAAVPAYVLKGDLPDLQSQGTIRFAVPEAEYLPRNGDPLAAEQALARNLADKLGLKAVFIAFPREHLLDEVNAGAADVIVASLGITPERSAQIAFSRPLRFVQQVLITRADDSKIAKIADLAGVEVTVRPSSAYAVALQQAKATVPSLVIKPAAEKTDTFDLIHQVARGELRATVADSDIFDATHAFEPNVRAAFVLTDKDPIAWGLRKSSSRLKAALDAFLVEKAMTGHTEDRYKADLAEVKKRGVLRVLTRNSSTTYFLYKGEQLGFEYELSREFAKSLGVRLEVIVPPSREALAEYLAQGRGDLIAAGMTLTPERQKTMAFTRPYQTVSELLVVPAKDHKTKGLADLRGKAISVRRSSSYFQSLSALKGKYGFTVQELPEDAETEDILQELGRGEIVATVADSDIVEVELTYDSSIRAIGPLDGATERPIAWALRPDEPKLKDAADAFIHKTYRSAFYNVTVNKYFKTAKQARSKAGDKGSAQSGQLSTYDPLAKKWAKKFELDWRLVTSQMYEESRFDPNAKSWVGALGLMQVMPRTAQDLHIDDVVSPDPGIQAGVKLLDRYAKMFEGDQLKEKDRIRFAMAAYNCGPGHVHDARRLARDRGLNPDKWFGNVEKTMLLLSVPKYAKSARHGYCRCSEPVKYVSEIQTRYDAYSQMVPLE